MSNFGNDIHFMYGHSVREHKFFRTYANDNNDLDDPLFTGFILSINELHSPLFSGGANYEYTYSKNSLNILGEQIENNLKDIVDKMDNEYYMTSPLEKINERKIGYGNQITYYYDNIDYGAIEYLYMVDKFLNTEQPKPQPINSNGGSIQLNSQNGSTPSTGTIENFNPGTIGTPPTNPSTGETSSTTLPTNPSTGETSSTTPPTNPSTSETTSTNTPSTGTIENFNPGTIGTPPTNPSTGETTNNETTQEEKELQELSEKYDKLSKDYNSKREEIDKLENELNELRNLRDVLLRKITAFNNLSQMKRQAKIFLDNIEKYISIGYNDEKINLLIADYFNLLNGEFKDFILTDNTIDEYNGQSYDIFYFHDLLSIYTSSFNFSEEEISLQINSINSQINDIYIKIYGSNDKGQSGSKSNYSEDSLYGQMKKSENDLNEFTKGENAEKIETILMEREIEEQSNSNNSQSNSSNTNNDQNNNNSHDKNDIGGANTTNVSNTTSISNNTSFIAPQSCADMLGFLNGMRKLTIEYPYVFQSVSGLDEAYKKYFKNDEPYQGSKDDKITISCLESVDMRVTSMFNRYFNSVYDKQYKRERVPVNLRRFECSIFVHDMRNFKTFASKMLNIDSIDSKILEVAMNHLSVVEFKFFDCEILPEETGNIFENVSNQELGEQLTTTFSFKYGNCIINYLPFGDLINYYKKTSNVEQLNIFESEKYNINNHNNNEYKNEFVTYRPEHDDNVEYNDFEEINRIKDDLNRNTQYFGINQYDAAYEEFHKYGFTSYDDVLRDRYFHMNLNDRYQKDMTNLARQVTEGVRYPEEFGNVNHYVNTESFGRTRRLGNVNTHQSNSNEVIDNLGNVDNIKKNNNEEIVTKDDLSFVYTIASASTGIPKKEVEEYCKYIGNVYNEEKNKEE